MGTHNTQEERCKLTPCLHEEQMLSCAAPNQSPSHLILAQTAPHVLPDYPKWVQ